MIILLATYFIAHQFKCCARGCKTTIRRFLDKKDARSTGNMRKHVKSCWGDEVLQSADQAKDAQEVRTKIVGSILWNGSITTSFERKGKGKVTYSHRQHTWTETNLRPFEIIKDKGFQSLMKTRRPEYYLPLPATVSHDVWLEHEGKVNFTTDGWTSTNHRALVTVSVHLKLKGVPLSLLLDIVEIPKVRMTYFCLT
ncbi:uncharacterized protein F5147DRAFT_741496 [Suillus discolor]|uniref:Uncharacterized protein n=1 Tax=Suillus discolor TaxID=1912936 RepID=A0A9P7K0A0_9AGAM|nr:uncharacterized protein F5147DRAFT_741496 [Suillus discolor]KAG2120467.1 hypothetical protein F5147DRAFT_741496 [Suillus discolor]